MENVSGHSESVKQERELFIFVFEETYKDVSAQMLNVSDKTQFLREAFDKEEKRIQDRAEGIHWITAAINNKIVGFASFHQEQKDDEIYIHLLAIHPLFQGYGIGKELVFSILKRLPDIRRIWLVTRPVYTQASEFYTRLGFYLLTDLPADIPDTYIGYEYFSKATTQTKSEL